MLLTERCRTMPECRTNVFAAMLVAAAVGSAATCVGLALAYQPMLQMAYGAGWHDAIMSCNAPGLDGIELLGEDGVTEPEQRPTAQVDPKASSGDNC